MNAALTLPLSADELREAVRLARPFNPARLDRVLRLDASRGLVEVQASASWESLAARLRPSALERAALWAGTATIGESMAANSAGPDGRPIVAHIESMTLVTADGDLRRVSRDSHPELFTLAVGGHGLFGTAYSITLRLESLACAAAEAADTAVLSLPGAQCGTRALQLLVAPENREAFVDELRARCEEWRVPLEGVEVRRTTAEYESALRWAKREYAAFTLRLGELKALGGAVRATQLRREIIDTAIAHGGSFAIASTPEATRAQVEACYPEIRQVLAEKRRLDPSERIVNEWYRHHRSLLGRDACHVRWAR